MPLITREGKGSKLSISEMDGNLLYLENLATTLASRGSKYLCVSGKGTPEENAAELQAAYDEAKTMPRYFGAITSMSEQTVYAGQTVLFTNNNKYYRIIATKTGSSYTILGSDNSVEITESEAKSTRITVIVAPGKYNFGGVTAFNINTPNIDIKSLTGKRDVLINSVNVSSDYVYVSGINCGTGKFAVSSGLSNIIIENCEGGNYSFGHNGNASGTFKDCKGGNSSFGATHTASGTFIDCIGGNNSFGGNGLASGTFTNCIGGDSSFGNIASGTFKDCIGGDFSFGSPTGTASGTFNGCIGGNYSFCYNGTASGTFTNCIGGDSSFGNIASGTFKDCIGGDFSFGSSTGIASGTFTNCTGGIYSFGDYISSGTFTNCVAGEYSFGGYNRTLSGKLINCTINGVLFTHSNKEIDLLINDDGIFQNIKSDGQGFTPVVHPNYSTQTTILPQKFGNQLVYQKVIILTNFSVGDLSINPLISYDDSIIPLSANIISVKGYYGVGEKTSGRKGVIRLVDAPSDLSQVNVRFDADAGGSYFTIIPSSDTSLREVCLIIEYTIPSEEGYYYSEEGYY